MMQISTLSCYIVDVFNLYMLIFNTLNKKKILPNTIKLIPSHSFIPGRLPVV